MVTARIKAIRKDVSVTGGALIRQRQRLVMQLRDRPRRSPMIAPIMADGKPLGIEHKASGADERKCNALSAGILNR